MRAADGTFERPVDGFFLVRAAIDDALARRLYAAGATLRRGVATAEDYTVDDVVGAFSGGFSVEIGVEGGGGGDVGGKGCEEAVAVDAVGAIGSEVSVVGALQLRGG